METPASALMSLPRPAHPLATRLLYAAAQVLLHLALPLLALGLLWRARKEPGHLRGLSERLGLGPSAVPGAVWIYAASLGEMRAASPLIRELRAGGQRILLTSASPAGYQAGRVLFGADPGITHRHMPLDLFWAVRLFLRRNRPALGVVLEIELWPAMLTEARRAGVPMVMANGNMLEPALARNRGLRAHLMRFYREFAHVFTRTEAYRARYIALGVDPARVSVVGELRHDLRIDSGLVSAGMALRGRWEGIERVLLIASSVEGEEPALLPMAARLLAADPGLGLVWAPRSPQRFDAVADGLAAAGVPVARRSALGAALNGPLPPVTRAIVGDSLGEMDAWYAMADLVFVGASLIDHGGHNVIEPLAHGRPVVMGPSIWGIAFATEEAARIGAFASLPDAAALEARITAMLRDPADLATRAAQARAHGRSMQGAAARTLAALGPLLPATGQTGDPGAAPAAHPAHHG